MAQLVTITSSDNDSPEQALNDLRFKRLIKFSKPLQVVDQYGKPVYKQKANYYRHIEARRAYQKVYDNKHKEQIRIRKADYYQRIVKVKSLKKNISLIPNIRSTSSLNYRRECNTTSYKDAFLHSHGRPNQRRLKSRYALGLSKSKMWFHMLDHKEISKQICHALGLKFGTSIYWKEAHTYIGKLATQPKIETHFLSFDGSGQDDSHQTNLPLLFSCMVESGLKGLDLLRYFAEHYSKNGYIQVFKGNRLLLTSQRENALKAMCRKENLSDYYDELKNVINDFPKEMLTLPQLV